MRECMLLLLEPSSALPLGVVAGIHSQLLQRCGCQGPKVHESGLPWL